MTLVTLDIALVMPENLRVRAVACSEFLSEKMKAGGSASTFQLGEPFPGEDEERCEPHVSLFMLAVDETEVNEVARVVERLARTLPALDVEGAEYRYNPHGAVEVYFTRSGAWRALQRAVIRSVEPLRRGRLREVDPSGTRICDLVENVPWDDVRRQQLVRYGYDEVADEENGGHDRFHPHVTLAWPRDHDYRVSLDGLPTPRSFSGRLAGLALFGMSPYGTCTKNNGVFSLGAIKPVASFMESRGAPFRVGESRG
ncbi:MAG: hypothetical protein ACRDRI_05870 [Pseudonocardiaceae bacterium]